MRVSAWSNGKKIFGISVGTKNRQHFESSKKLGIIKVRIDGHWRDFRLSDGFWKDCPEFRDSGSAVIHDWLDNHGFLRWTKGKPPQFELTPNGDGRFCLDSRNLRSLR